MKYSWLIGIAFWLSGGCHEVTVGFLTVENASYDRDSMVVRTKLDTASGQFNPEFQKYLDFGYSYLYVRDTLKIAPRIGTGADYEWAVVKGSSWVSYKIEGVQGTLPIYVAIKEIRSEDGGNPEIMRRELKVRADGTLILPTFVRSPVGRYSISLRFSNEGYTKDVDHVYTIIVTE